jgi:hypothetical protein
MTSTRVAGTMGCAGVFVGILLAACKSGDASKDRPAGSIAASPAVATTASGAATAPAASSAASPATPTTSVPTSPEGGGPPGGCKRLQPGTTDLMCNLGKDFCCENVATGQEKCVAHEDAQGFHCSPDGAWLVAMGCTTSSMCGPAQKCCVQEPVPGFFQTACAATCQREEACVPGLAGGECKDPPSFDCVASDASRTGGHCVARAASGAKVVPCRAGLERIAAPGHPGGACAHTCEREGRPCEGGWGCWMVSAMKDDGSSGEAILACVPKPPPPTGGDAVCAALSGPMGKPCGDGGTCGPFMEYADGWGLHSPCVMP